MPLIDEIAARDKAADDAVAAIRTPEELAAKQCAWRTWWLDALGGMPARTPLNARVVGSAEFDGFRLENIIFESQPGVYVSAHLAIPTGTTGVSPVAARVDARPPVTGVSPVVDATSASPPFPAEATFCTPTHQVRDLPGFKSVYALIADEARRLAKERKPRTREELREIVRRRAGMRPLAELPATAQKPFDHPKFGWWYLSGVFGTRRENEAAMLATLGRSVVGRDAENILIDAAARVKANGGKPVPLAAKGWDCIAAAHAYAAEPQLFSEVRFTEPPPSWMELVTNPDPAHDSYAIAVWGALKDYDWPDLVP
ncbi:MAG: hypothetical protein IJJ84_08275 [Kiritimatiellae bacterium]|nr:hypothetical protein [Kiritimatiellia bacterium]